MQQQLIIQNLSRKNNTHKNLGLCCSTLEVQEQEYLSLFLSFLFNPLSHSRFFCLSLSQPYSLALFPSLNLVNSFRSYQDKIREKRLYLVKFSANAFVRFLLHCGKVTVGEDEHRPKERGRESRVAYGLETVPPLALKSLSRYCVLNPSLYPAPCYTVAQCT